jgi:hypothetical protein
MPFVPVPRRNPETSQCEVRKSVRDSSGVPRTLEVVAVVKGVAPGGSGDKGLYKASDGGGEEVRNLLLLEISFASDWSRMNRRRQVQQRAGQPL